MATNTYVELDKITANGSVSSITFNSIPSTYTNLVIVIDASVASGSNNLDIRFNGDTGSNYSYLQLAGSGSSALCGGITNSQTSGRLDYYGYVDTSRYLNIVNIMNYTSTTRTKLVLSRSNNAANGVSLVGNRWNSTAAITSVTLLAGTFTAGSTFSLYGIKAWTAETTPKATGGYVYSDSTYWYHAFPFSSTFVPNQSLTADILCVAGGGGGGAYRSGGGGAGGLLAHTSQSLTATTYNITVGAGGAGSSSTTGSNGANSQFASLTASVGGGGGGSGNGPGTGANGGSGGGGTGFYGDKAGGTGTSGQGFAGGTGSDTNPYPSGGGGGAGAVGGTYSGSIAGTGGIGATSSLINAIGAATAYGEISNGNYYFAGGGGGGVYLTTGTPGAGGKGGGAAGALANAARPNSGIVSTGGGGGGSASAAAGGSDLGGAGGSGIVVIRYAK